MEACCYFSSTLQPSSFCPCCWLLEEPDNLSRRISHFLHGFAFCLWCHLLFYPCSKHLAGKTWVQFSLHPLFLCKATFQLCASCHVTSVSTWLVVIILMDAESFMSVCLVYWWIGCFIQSFPSRASAEILQWRCTFLPQLEHCAYPETVHLQRQDKSLIITFFFLLASLQWKDLMELISFAIEVIWVLEGALSPLWTSVSLLFSPPPLSLCSYSHSLLSSFSCSHCPILTNGNSFMLSTTYQHSPCVLDSFLILWYNVFQIHLVVYFHRPGNSHFCKEHWFLWWGMVSKIHHLALEVSIITMRTSLLLGLYKIQD